MAQQQSPWLEGAYGWEFGEGGWNSGMDENLLKFSFLFDRNVDSITASLPAATNGQAHYLTTDNRIYFAVGTTYYSTPVPKNFMFFVKSTGNRYQFNGTSIVQIDSPTQIDSRLDALEVTLSALGTAAFEDASSFATQSELDVASAQANSYTDSLASSLLDSSNASLGASLVGYEGSTVRSTLDSLVSFKGEYVRPQDFGAVGNGVADDTAAVLAAIADGRPLYWGGIGVTYRLTSEISHRLVKDAVWRSDGAIIEYDSPTPTQRVIIVRTDQYNFHLSGPLTLRVNDKSYSGLQITNLNSGFGDASGLVFVQGLRVFGCYRSGTIHSGGDALYVAGRFKKVQLDNIYISGVKAAAGTIDLNNGVSGISVLRDSTLSVDADSVVISNYFVENVFVEDPLEQLGANGVRVFSAWTTAGVIPTESAVFLTSGKVRNAMGRAVKLQTEWADVSGLHIYRDGTIHSGFIGNEDVDFQCAGGSIRGLMCHYASNFPTNIINSTATRVDGRLNSKNLTISDVSVVQTGSGTGVQTLFRLYSEFVSRCNITVSGVQVSGSKSPARLIDTFSGDTLTVINVLITGVQTTLTGSLLREPSSVPCRVRLTAMAINNNGSSVPLWVSSASSPLITSSLLGINVGIT
jgi:hypothetical protein